MEYPKGLSSRVEPDWANRDQTCPVQNPQYNQSIGRFVGELSDGAQ